MKDLSAKLPKDFLLIAACCRWPPSKVRNDAIRAAADAVSDWQMVLRVANRHRVMGLVSNGLASADIVLSPDVAKSLLEGAAKIAHQGLLFAAETARLQNMCDTGGLPVLFVKGTTLAMLAYNNIGIKFAWDIDMLVCPGDVEKACGLLGNAGYERILPPATLNPAQFQKWIEVAREAVFRDKSKGTFVELHWLLAENPMHLPGLTAASPGQAVAVGGNAAVRTLTNEDLFSYLCVHGARHGWARLKWIADVAAFLNHYSQEQIEGLYHASQANGAGRCSGQALLLCERLFGTELSPVFAAQLRADRKTRWLEATALDVMAGGDGVSEVEDRPLSNLPIFLSHFLFMDDWRYRLLEWRLKSTGWTDMTNARLPRGLHFLYPVMRIPSWLWRHILFRRR